MRPINKGVSPQVFTKYEDAKQPLANRIGCYCSYCERRLPNNVAIEHIFPKDPTLGYAHLREEWDNFLLACVNCNSTKRVTIIDESTYLLPDRDNTFHCYDYLDSGLVEVNANNPIAIYAQNTSNLVGLNKYSYPFDPDEELLIYHALERASQRKSTFDLATKYRIKFDQNLIDAELIIDLALGYGFFSIWMKTFEGVTAVRQELIRAFIGTEANCFDDDTDPISPRPANHLNNSGKA
jgi:hypothetical protein